MIEDLAVELVAEPLARARDQLQVQTLDILVDLAHGDSILCGGLSRDRFVPLRPSWDRSCCKTNSV